MSSEDRNQVIDELIASGNFCQYCEKELEKAKEAKKEEVV